MSIPSRGKRRIIHDNFTVLPNDPAIITNALQRPNMDLEHEIEALPGDAFASFKQFVSKNKSMDRIIDHCIANDVTMKALEAGRGDFFPVRLDTMIPTPSPPMPDSQVASCN